LIFKLENDLTALQNQTKMQKRTIVAILILLYSMGIYTQALAQEQNPIFSYTISIPSPATHSYNVSLHSSGWLQDTVQLKMPKWMPGYYQIMNYANDLSDMIATNEQGMTLPLKKINENTWELTGIKQQDFTLAYTIKTSKQFVANSYVDADHAYLIPGNSFLYADGFLNTPVSVTIINPAPWPNIATGLATMANHTDVFMAPDFDILYDSPFLLGNLEALSSFKVGNKNHHFIGYQLGTFDKTSFIEKLAAIVTSGSEIIGDIPYKNYTFIAIGPGRGGIEHLNNTTISFDGNQLDTEEKMNKMMNFLAHEYFHHYNVKRIRPFEVGPFDYDNGSKTNLLWVSEGLSVYYEYLIVKRAGLSTEKILFENLENNINTVENNPGRHYQSLVQASFNTWKEGPFGAQGEEKGKTISYYEKGPLVGLLLDFAIRHATQNEKSLDKVMQFLYEEYYQKKERGFTDAEFRQACETIAGTSLAPVFEYVYTTKELDYSTYLKYAGLELLTTSDAAQKKKFSIQRISNPNALQLRILSSWLGN